MQKILDKLKFGPDGLIPAIVQDVYSKQVLMFAWMNRKSLELTLKTKNIWFFSRSRKKLWMKGETSGNIQKVKAVYFDCDDDCILLEVEQVGGAACHMGYRSCFFRKLVSENKLKVTQKRVFDPKKVYK
ncbi:MAG: phosphoribosyl-AMP cyclohydrolase [Elusimicrobiota bacterium]|nr:phosphoribosyl-AMP cyclohydrolase [Elusimicrobiota bacterium]